MAGLDDFDEGWVMCEEMNLELWKEVRK